jgi:hypothetical protein
MVRDHGEALGDQLARRLRLRRRSVRRSHDPGIASIVLFDPNRAGGTAKRSRGGRFAASATLLVGGQDSISGLAWRAGDQPVSIERAITSLYDMITSKWARILPVK